MTCNSFVKLRWSRDLSDVVLAEVILKIVGDSLHLNSGSIVGRGSFTGSVIYFCCSFTSTLLVVQFAHERSLEETCHLAFCGLYSKRELSSLCDAVKKKSSERKYLSLAHEGELNSTRLSLFF